MSIDLHFVSGCGVHNPRARSVRRGKLQKGSFVDAVRQFVSWVGFSLLGLVVLLAPWSFGAWEPWLFWPFTSIVLASSGVLGLKLLLRGTGDDRRSTSRSRGHRHRPRSRRVEQFEHRRLWLGVAYGLFLAYALWHMMAAPVFMDAQRNFLLFFTPLLIVLHVMFGFSGYQRRLFHRLLLANFLALAAYGLVNHALNGSVTVLWRPGYAQYYSAGRASGSYFCPDHFAGAMEMGLAMALGLLLARETRTPSRVFAALLVPATLAGVVLSKSRGGGLTAVVVLAAALVWGFRQWAPRLRHCWRLLLVGAAVMALVAMTLTGAPYLERFGHWFGWKSARGKPWSEKMETVGRRVRHTARWQMWSAAVRAWQPKPLLGIGAGMHRHIWPHVAASDDGDRETGRWPTRLNNTHHSYETHNDWLQLLEEYGVVGLLLFLAPCVLGFGILQRGVKRETDACRETKWTLCGGRGYPVVLAAMLAAVAMGFHSLGDFNLQIPANTWLLATIVALGLTSATRPPHRTVEDGEED